MQLAAYTLDVIMPEILLRVIMGMFNVTRYEVYTCVHVCKRIKQLLLLLQARIILFTDSTATLEDRSTNDGLHSLHACT